MAKLNKLRSTVTNCHRDESFDLQILFLHLMKVLMKTFVRARLAAITQSRMIHGNSALSGAH